MRFLVLAPVLLALGQPVLAADAASAPTGAAQSVPVSASAAADPEQPKVVCHQEAAIGSMMMHKVCTRAQTEAERNATQEVLRNIPPNNSIAHPAAGSGH